MGNGDLDKKSHLGRIASNRDRTKRKGIVYFCRKFMQNYTFEPPKMPNLIFGVTFRRLLLLPSWMDLSILMATGQTPQGSLQSVTVAKLFRVSVGDLYNLQVVY